MITKFKSVVTKALQKFPFTSGSNSSNQGKPKELPPSAWLDRLREEKFEVESFSQSITNDFTEHSRTLESLVDDIEELKSSCNAVVDIISADEGETPIQFAYQLFKKSEDIIMASFDQFRMIFDSVRTLKELIQSIEANQNQLSKITVPLKMITVQYRITASMMDEKTRQEFYDLADKLAILINEINQRIDKQFRDLTDTGAVCSEIIEGLDLMVSEYEGQISKQLGTSRSNLGSLGSSLDNSHRLIDQITECSDRLSNGIFNIMVSMQAQDMTSQKLEHICSAIDSICDRLQTSEKKDLAATLYFVREASKIQSTQLDRLFGDLESAMDSIRSSTLNTDTEIESIAKATEELSQIGSQTDLLRTSAESVSQILSFVESTIDKTRTVLVSLKPLREKFTDSTAKVMNIAVEMRMVAVNAQVYASNVTDGEALEVLSHSTQVQSIDAKSNIESISHSLEKVAASLTSAEESLAHFAELGQVDMDQLLHESEIAQNELQRLERDLPNQMNKIQLRREKVTQHTRQFAEKLTLNDSIRSKGEQILALFKEISTAKIKEPRGERLEREQQNISSLQSNYTMQSEVNVHNEAVDTGALAAQRIEMPPPPEDISDGFEAFDFEDTSLDRSSDLAETPTEEADSSKPKSEKCDDNVDLF